MYAKQVTLTWCILTLALIVFDVQVLNFCVVQFICLVLLLFLVSYSNCHCKVHVIGVTHFWLTPLQSHRDMCASTRISNCFGSDNLSSQKTHKLRWHLAGSTIWEALGAVGGRDFLKEVGHWGKSLGMSPSHVFWAPWEDSHCHTFLPQRSA